MLYRKRAALLLAVLVPTITLLLLLGWWHKKHPAEKPLPPLFQPSSQFAIGINYPWRNYGGDFGANVWGGHEGVNTPKGLQEVDADFNWLSSQGLNVVRWFIFCDGRGGLKFGPDGSVAGIDQYVLDDMTAALTIAHKYKLRVVFVLLDFNFVQRAQWVGGQLIGGHRKVIEKPELTLTLHKNALAPIFAAFGNSPDIAAWEIINEPEWVLTEYPYWETKKIGVKKMQTFVTSTALFIKQHAKQPVTVGSASLAGLDYCQRPIADWIFCSFNSYPYLERNNPLDIPAVGPRLQNTCCAG